MMFYRMIQAITCFYFPSNWLTASWECYGHDFGTSLFFKLDISVSDIQWVTFLSGFSCSLIGTTCAQFMGTFYMKTPILFVTFNFLTFHVGFPMSDDKEASLLASDFVKSFFLFCFFSKCRSDFLKLKHAKPWNEPWHEPHQPQHWFALIIYTIWPYCWPLQNFAFFMNGNWWPWPPQPSPHYLLKQPSLSPPPQLTWAMLSVYFTPTSTLISPTKNNNLALLYTP